MTQTHYFRTRIHQFVSGMDDSAVVLVEADSERDAIGAVTRPRLGNDEYRVFNRDLWDSEKTPSTGPVKYVGTVEGAETPLLLTHKSGVRVAVGQ